MRKHFINLVITSVCALAVFLIGFSVGLVRSPFVSEVQVTTTPTKTVSLLINDGQYVKSYTNEALPQPPTVIGLLEALGEQENITLDIDKSSSFGAFVKQIGDKTNGQNKSYWQYFVNGAQPQVAADRFILRGGETVFWTFSQSER